MKSHSLLFLTILCVALFFLRLGSISLYQVAEARNAECAREMLLNDDWIVPVFNGELRTDKPALEYFAMITAYKIGGVSEGSARFFSAVCGLLLILFTFLISAKYIGKKAAWLTSLILLASMHLVMQFRLATPDPYLILLDTLALYYFLTGWTAYTSFRNSVFQARKNWWLMYIFLGLAVLAKGPIGIALPGLIILLFLFVKRKFNWKLIKAIQPWMGLILVLLFCLPWYVWVHYKTDGAWTEGFFFEHNVSRFNEAVGGHRGSFLLTFLFVFAGMLPFSVFIIQSIRSAWKDLLKNDLILLSFISLSCVILFYAFSSTKLINYTVPAYPFIAILLGQYWQKVISKNRKVRSFHISFLFLLLIGFGLPAAYYFWIGSIEGMAGFRWLVVFLTLFPIGMVLAYSFFLKKKIEKSFYAVTYTFIISTLLIFSYPYPLLDTQTPVKKVEELITQDRPIAGWDRFNDAFVYYSKKTIPLFKDSTELKGFLEKHPDALILSNGKNLGPLFSNDQLELIEKNREIFESRTSHIFQKIQP